MTKPIYLTISMCLLFTIFTLTKSIIEKLGFPYEGKIVIAHFFIVMPFTIYAFKEYKKDYKITENANPQK